MRFAYLIMIHQDTLILTSLLRMLDDERNDIYIHADAKIEFDFKEKLSRLVKRSNIYFIKDRIAVFWAHISQVEAEYTLFQEAYKRGYSYYHLLSGADLSIKSQDDIYRFFNDNNGKEFIGFDANSCSDRVERIHLFPKKFRSNSPIAKLLRIIFLKMQKLIRFSIFRKKGKVIKKGTNWVSVTHAFVGYILKKKNFILKSMKYAKSPDEHYKQMLAYNSHFRNKVYCYHDEYIGCMRLTDWLRGNPYHWKAADYNAIIASDKLFARKFDDNSLELVTRLERFIKGDNV